MRSRLQQKKRRLSRNRQLVRRGGTLGLPISGIANKFWKIQYEVLCDENISASNLFDIGKVTLYNMERKKVIALADNLVISRLYNRSMDAYLIQFDVQFQEEQSANWVVNTWKRDYFDGIRNENIMCDPVENTFFAEPSEEIEYPPYIAPSGYERYV
jgi:hypothetical protein